MSARPVVSAKDPARLRPEGSGERQDDIRRALALLSEEKRRLERLGFEWPLARCREQIRYWSFLQALHALERETPGGRL